MPKTYVADTVALARYFEDALPAEADRAFREAEAGEATILVPSVVIGEFIYIALKGRLRVRDPRSTILELLDDLQATPHLRQVDMTTEAWMRFLEARVPELHDRMIFAVADAAGVAAVITGDPEIRSAGLPSLW